MPSRTLDAQIDRLYQLPLDEFTEARNALAKETGNSEIKKLQKPPVAAWSLNQVYWSRRPVYDAFVAAATALRNAHGAVLAGKKADLRATGKAHEDALEAMLKAALAVLSEAGQPATDATRQAIASTLRALPSPDDQPGRLTRTLQPGGFSMLAGFPVAASSPAAKPPKTAPRPADRKRASSKAEEEKEEDEEDDARSAERAKAIAAAREQLADAQRAEKAAEQLTRREEFEAARMAREAERAEKKLADARTALEAAQAAVDEAESEASAAAKKRDASARRVRDAADALARAHVRAETARAAMNRLGKP